MTELPDNNGDEANRWLGGAEEELVTARVVAEHPEAPGRAACFHAHLAAEKALKALLIAFDTPFPPTHDLPRLRALLPPGVGDGFTAGLEALNPWVIGGRYPEDADDVSPGEVRALVETAERVVSAARQAFPDEKGGMV